MSNNQNTKDPVWADGFKFRNPHPNAPDFVKGNISVKVDDAITFLKNNHKNGWVNIQVKVSQAGNPFMILDEWTPNGNNNNSKITTEKAAAPTEEVDLPF